MTTKTIIAVAFGCAALATPVASAVTGSASHPGGSVELAGHGIVLAQVTPAQPGQPGQQPGQPGNQQAQGQQPGQPGQQPGKPGEKGQKGQSQERNQAKGEGNREGTSPTKNAASSGQTQQGDGSFINLQKRERDKVQQNAEAAFPAEFRELIKQYNINIKNGPAAQKPTPPTK